MAANATLSIEMRLTQVDIEGDGLMAAVLTRGIAAAAADAFLTVEGGIHDSVAVKVSGGVEIRQLLAYQIRQVLDAAFSHIVLQPQHEVIDDAVTVLHHGSAHLHVAAAQLDELQGVAPCLDATDATQLNAFAIVGGDENGIFRHLEDMAQSDGLHSTS